MHLLRRMAVIGAASAMLLGTVLTGAANAATGGGCSAKTNNVQACSSWVTGQGFSYNFFLDGWSPVQKGELMEIGVFYCKTTTVATSSTPCSSFVLQSGTEVDFIATHLGQYPAGTETWTASRTIHGEAYSLVVYQDANGVVHALAQSPKVYW